MRRPAIPYDEIVSADGDAELHSISQRSQLLLLSQSGMVHWAAHWYHQDGSELTSAEIEQIEDWASWAEHELLETASGGEEEIPAPFWDTGDDADDTFPPDEQPWYGAVDDPDAAAEEMSFEAVIADWAITAFIAYSGNIGAAIAFHTVAPRFVLAFERGDVGEIFRIIVNAADYASVDTSDASEGDVIRTPVLPEESETGYDLLIVKVG